MSNISFIIFTKNEEKRIGYIIRNFIKYGPVLIFDDSSADKTKDVSIELGAQYIMRPKSEEIFVERQDMYDFIKPHIKTDWIYWGFADNMMPKNLLDKLSEISKQNKIKYVKLPLYTYFYGETKYPILKGYAPMFFMKEYVTFTGNTIHGSGNFLGNKNEILVLPNSKENAVRHYSLYDLNKFISGHLRYAEHEARLKYNNGKKFSIGMMLGAMARYFFLFYKFSFRNGIKGLVAALMYSYFRMMVYVRLYEIENDIDIRSIEESFAKDKNRIINEINSL